MNKNHSPPSLPNSLYFILCYILLLLSLGSLYSAAVTPNGRSVRFQPHEEGHYRETKFTGTVTTVGQTTGPFQLCLECKCCEAGAPTPTCAIMPCCFALDCQIPGKPLGVCAFVPKTCNCTSCAV